jgi:hypothetical protein
MTPTDAKPRPPSANLIRVRRCLARRRRGMRCLTIELGERDLDALIRRWRLSPDYRNDPAAIRMALYRFISDALF